MSTQPTLRTIVCCLGMLSIVAACGPNERRVEAPKKPVEPEIKRLESTSQTLHPGDSVDLAVVAGPAGEEWADAGFGSAGDAGTKTGGQALSHDAESRDVSDGHTAPSNDTASSADTSSERDTSTSPSDAGGTPDTSNAPTDTGVSSTGDDASTENERDASSAAPEPEPPSGRVPENWTVSWSVDADGWSIAGEGATATLQAADQYESTADVTVIVTTPDDRSDSATLSVTTGSNTPPAVTNTTAEPNPVAPDGEIEVSVDASDPNGDELAYDWQIADPWSLSETSGSNATIVAPNRDDVFATLQVTISDGYGGQTTSEIRLETLANTAPSLSSVTASPPQVSPGGTITLEADATDAEQSDLSYTWTIPDDWSADTTTGERIDVTAPDTYDVTATAEVVVADPRGAQTSGSVVISTRDNQGPTIDSFSANPTSVQKGGTIDLEVIAQDPNGDALQYDWSVAKQQTWTLSTNGSEATLQSPEQPNATTRVEVAVEDEEGKTARASKVVSTKPNVSPSIGSVSANPTTVSPGKTSTVSVSASDPDGDSLDYQWSATGSWSVSGSGASASITPPSTYGATGVVTVQVTDGFGGSATGSVTVSTRQNGDPIIALLSANPPTVAPKTLTRLVVNASDPNGDTLSYNWSLPNGWTKQTSTGQTIPPNELVLQAPGSYDTQATVSVTVTDGQGGSSKASVPIFTEDNGAPTIDSLTASPADIAPGGTTTIEASTRDPNGDSLNYSWTLPGSKWSQSGSGAKITVTAPDQFGLQKTIRLDVSDGNGGTATASVAVSTADNQPPTLDSLTASPQTVQPNKTLTVEAKARDSDSKNLNYNWTIPKQWSTSGSGAKITVTAPGQFGVSGTVEVAVSDGDGGQASGSVVVSTADNQTPSVSSVTASPQPASPGASVQVEALAADPDGDSLGYSWTVPKGWNKSGSGSQITLQSPNSYGKSGVVRVTVDDGNGATAKGSTLVSTETNQNPVLSALTANPQAVAPNGSITVEATAADPNGDSLNYQWTPPSGWSKSGSGDTITLQAPGSYGNSGLVQVTIDDGQGGTATGSVLVRTDRNQSPVISNVTANPVVLSPGGTTTVRASATDPNNDSLGYSWNVPQGWTQKGSGAQIEVVAPNKTSASATLTVTVSDGNGGRSKGAVVVQTVNNRSPQIDSLTANPKTVAPGGSITLTSKVTDPDGDSINYSWTIPKGWSKSGSGAQITLTAPDAYGRTDTIKLTASDGRSQATDKVLVQTDANKAPSVDSLKAQSNPVLQNASTTVQTSASDPYGDSLSYRWSLSNNSWTRSGSGSSIALDAQNNANSSVKVTVTVDDGNGGTASSSITVQTKGCSSGTANCDGSANNGCEVSLNSDANNCGSCGNSCGSNESCSSGSCVSHPAKCKTGNGPDYGNPYVVCDANANSAWISAAKKQTQYFNARKICRNLGYNKVVATGGTCGNTCGYCEGSTSCNNTGSKSFNGGGGSHTRLGYWVHWRCK